MPILTDIHEAAHAAPVAEVADVLQIPAFLSRQTDLLEAAARTNRVVNIKKGQFLAPADIRHAIAKVTATGNERVIVTERGFTFGYTTSSSTCGRSPSCAPSATPSSTTSRTACSCRAPATASPPARPSSSSRSPRRASAAGVDGVFLEVHEEPSRAKSDAQNALRLDLLEPLLTRLVRIHAIERPAARPAGEAAPRT